MDTAIRPYTTTYGGDPLSHLPMNFAVFSIHIALAAGVLAAGAAAATPAELLASTDGKATAQTADGGIRLELEGTGLTATAAHPPTGADHGGEAGGAVPLVGHYNGESGGVLRLRFGPPKPEPEAGGKLIAFWKFDEAEGAEIADLKAPDAPAKIVGAVPEKERPPGVGFGEVRALPLDGKSHVQTQFSAPLDGHHSICMWAKTGGAGVLLDKGEPDAGGPAAGSRLVHIGDDGRLRAIIDGPGGSSLESKTALNDGRWHHFAWTVSPTHHRLFVDGKLEDEVKEIAVPLVGSGAALRFGKGIERPAGGGAPRKLAAFAGTIDNVRIYDFVLNQRQVGGFYRVGTRRNPIVITSEPQTEIRVGETFSYSIEFTGAPSVQFRFIGLPDWLKFEGRITGTPTEADVGRSGRIAIVGLCPWGPAQQEFHIDVLPALVPDGWEFSIDGKPAPLRRLPDGIEVDLPAGEGKWEFTGPREAGGG